MSGDDTHKPGDEPLSYGIIRQIPGALDGKELDTILRCMERIRNVRGAIDVLEEEGRECRVALGTADDGATGPPISVTKYQRKAAQRRDMAIRNAVYTLENSLRRLEKEEADAQRRRDRERAIRECEATLVDLAFAAETASMEVIQQQAKLTALRREAEDDDPKRHTVEEEGYAVVKLP
ncbi:Hypothetical protein D9617_55g071620 [Elsinoe fawcettii]|nr:Hypothetical protein D9617_55g071620 [Elsinoe fawcettii]